MPNTQLKKKFILTCEHAGNEIPEKYTSLFKGKEEELYSHKGMDFGALRLAKHLAASINLPLYYSTISRLLVEANRSLDSDELFSEFTKKLPVKEKETILNTYYAPHRNQVEEQISNLTASGYQVIHFAIHTFTPATDGEVRKAAIGILFDPKRVPEHTIAAQLKEQLTAHVPELHVVYNAPYPGTADGFPTYLRKRFIAEEYAGFELEVNQKFFLNGEPGIWDNVVAAVTDSLRGVINQNR
ncbi:N-formylglutamate amidohydrolase [Pontibacter sp. H259]|uniref:N-formylglutamate amidohydrolase n=1 Tax=Pontibacter sp. H259 TaxID=3133421 RepID=UPI0030C20BE2